MTAERLLSAKTIFWHSGQDADRGILRTMIDAGATVREVGWSKTWNATEYDLWPDEWRDDHSVYSVESPDGTSVVVVASFR